MARETQPTAPASLPKYLADGLPKQDIATLRDVQVFVKELIEWQQRPVEPEHLPDSADVTDESSEKGIIVEEYVQCGDDTCHCADPDDPGHGPYEYRYWRENGELQSKYIDNE